MNIGDLFLRILANTEGFAADLIKQATKAGDDAGATLGQRMGSAIKKNGAKIIGATLLAGVAIASKGLLELQNITADFAAETGASADEADRAGKAINEMSSRNIQPMREIGDTLTKVHTDMGLVGDQAEKVTEKFLRFGRVTKRNAADEVAAFDDILDAWNLTADDAAAIMDALVVSHQRYGGVISDDEIALRDLAPVLLATNQSWEDGLALINLFKASGADVAVAVTGITKALAKVKNPEELQALIADIAATEDPFLRAAKASDLFGAKAGPKLANVLKPGAAALDEYKLSIDETAGATEEAAAVLDNTLGARFQLLIKQAGSAIIGLGNDWGGLATVIATTLTVAGGLGGGKLTGLLAGGIGKVWTKAASSGAAKRAIAFAGGKAATVYLAGLIAGDAIGAALVKAWAATGGRVLKAAGIQGALAGRAFALGAAAAIVAAPLIVLKVALDIQSDINAQGDALRQQAVDFAKKSTDVELQKAIADVRAQLDGMVFNTFDSKNKVVATLNALIEEANRRTEGVNTALESTRGAAADLDQKGSKSFVNLGAAAQRMYRETRDNAVNIANRIHELTSKLIGEAQAMIDGYYDPIILADELRVAKDTVKADTIARNATKAGSVERHQADLTLANSKKNLDQTRLNLLASGNLTKKEQKAWLDELQKKYKSATGAAKTRIQELINKIHELQRVPSTAIRISVVGASGLVKPGDENRATGGPVVAGRAYIVNENTPNSEIWVPSVSGRVLSGAVAAAPASMMQGGDTNITVPVQGLLPKLHDPRDIVTELIRLRDVGILPSRSTTPTYPRQAGT